MKNVLILVFVLMAVGVGAQPYITSTPEQVDSVVQAAVNKGVGSACLCEPSTFTATLADTPYNPATNWTDGNNSNFDFDTTTGELTFLGGEGLFMFLGNSSASVGSVSGAPVLTYRLIRERDAVETTLVETNLDFTTQDRLRPFNAVKLIRVEQGDILKVRISSDTAGLTVNVEYIYVAVIQIR